MIDPRAYHCCALYASAAGRWLTGLPGVQRWPRGRARGRQPGAAESEQAARLRIPDSMLSRDKVDQYSKSSRDKTLTTVRR